LKLNLIAGLILQDIYIIIMIFSAWD